MVLSLQAAPAPPSGDGEGKRRLTELLARGPCPQMRDCGCQRLVKPELKSCGPRGAGWGLASSLPAPRALPYPSKGRALGWGKRMGRVVQTWRGLCPGATDASCGRSGRWTPTFLAIPKTPHSSSLLAFPSVGGGQWPGSELAARGLLGEGLRSGLEGLLPGSPVPGTAPGVLVILINRKSPPPLPSQTGPCVYRGRALKAQRPLTSPAASC